MLLCNFFGQEGYHPPKSESAPIPISYLFLLPDLQQYFCHSTCNGHKTEHAIGLDNLMKIMLNVYHKTPQKLSGASHVDSQAELTFNEAYCEATD